jgi:hypothetical protein
MTHPRFIGPPRGPARGTYREDPETGAYVVFMDFRRPCSHPGCTVNLTSDTRWERRWLCIEHGREMLRDKAAARRRAARVPTQAERVAKAAALRQSKAPAEKAAKARSAVEAAPVAVVQSLQHKEAPPVPTKKKEGTDAKVHAPNFPGLQTLPPGLHIALQAWLKSPGEEGFGGTDERLKAALRDYELKFRLRQLIPEEPREYRTKAPATQERPTPPPRAPRMPDDMNPTHHFADRLDYLGACDEHGV